ncbi:hypothetical protein [Desulfosporosinus acididurans]|nr:hypothetical protein [Desulfosporosinus acididurans]
MQRNSELCPIVRRRRTFWDDPGIAKKLDAIPEGERGVVIRMALRSYFNINPGATPPPDSAQGNAEQLRAIFQQILATDVSNRSQS